MNAKVATVAKGAWGVVVNANVGSVERRNAEWKKGRTRIYGMKRTSAKNYREGSRRDRAEPVVDNDSRPYICKECFQCRGSQTLA